MELLDGIGYNEVIVFALVKAVVEQEDVNLRLSCVIEPTLRLPDIPGDEKLIYNHIYIP